MAKQEFTVSFGIEGATELARNFKYIGEKIKDYSVPLIKSKDLLLKTWDDNFDTTGATIGEPWLPLSKKNPDRNKRRVLEKTGKMRKSFETKTTSESLYLWNSSEYFKHHQFGAPKNNLPKRVMMKIDDKRKKEIVKFFEEEIVKVMSHRQHLKKTK